MTKLRLHLKVLKTLKNIKVAPNLQQLEVDMIVKMNSVLLKELGWIANATINLLTQIIANCLIKQL